MSTSTSYLSPASANNASNNASYRRRFTVDGLHAFVDERPLQTPRTEHRLTVSHIRRQTIRRQTIIAEESKKPQTHTETDETKPLLAARLPLAGRGEPTPLPWKQLTILLTLQLLEPFTSQVIAPFIYELIRGAGVTGGDESKTILYVGILQSVFFASQAVTVLFWARISDAFGRRPILLTGSFGIFASLLMFAFSSSYGGYIVARIITGGMNGYIGVVKTMMGEVTDITNAGQAFGYMPIAWSAGATLGPLVGGQLSDPARRFPSVFGGTFFESYPHLMALAVPALVALAASIAVHFRLIETAPSKVNAGYINEKHDSTPPRSIFTKPVIIAVANYCLLALLDYSYRSVRPTFFASPIGAGGLGLLPPRMGLLIAVAGFTNGVFQVTCFARFHARFGTKRLFMFALPWAAVVFACFPLMEWISVRANAVTPAVWGVFVIQSVCFCIFSMTQGCIFVSILSSAPDRNSIGAVNNFSQIAVATTRAIGPLFVNTLFSLSLKQRIWGGNLVWIVFLGIVVFALCMGTLLPSGRPAVKQEEEDEWSEDED